MFCRNCGEQYPTDQAVICVKCGTPKGQGSNFCPNCGKPVNPTSAVCMNCGVALQNAAQYQPKSKMAAGLLGIFLGAFGVHNFYLGYTTKAVIQLVCSIVGIVLSCIFVGIFLTMGMSIWGLIEGIMILVGKIDKDANGTPLQ
ncbi:MAG: TM2 domain-containing protein [Lachnospiraceae bacterium]|nr:TM2 domain-containing protein [Lachnospiraceae bacterium]